MLLEKGDVFDIKNDSDLDKIRNFLKSNLKSANKKSLDELYSIYIYLCFQVLVRDGLSICPINIEKSESPDFIIRSRDDESAGVEIVKSATRSQKHAESHLEKMPSGSILELPYYQDDTTSKETVEEGLRLPCEKLESSGYGDNGREIQWSNTIKRRLEEKYGKLNGEHFRIFQSNQLIILDDAVLLVDFTYSIRRLVESFDPNSYKIKFDKVCIVSEKFLYDVFGQCGLWDYKF